MPKLTKLTCDKAVYEGKGAKAFYAVWDSELSGFGLRVTPQGGKSFVIKYRSHGKQRIMTIGRYGILTVDQARKLAREKLVEVNQGGDPAEEKDKATHGTRMSDLTPQFMEGYSKPFKKSWKEDHRRIQSYILPTFGKLNVSDIRRPDVIKFHADIGENHGKYEANRCLALLSTLIEYARRIEMIEANHANPCRMVDKFEEKSRDTFMRMEDLPRLIEILETEPNIYIRSAIMLFLLTGMRKTELLTTRWENVDLERGELRLPDTKSGETQYVHLCESAVEILKNIPKVVENPYVFASSIEGKRIWEINRPWRRIRHEAGLDGITIHDLRRSFGSWLALEGNSLYLIKTILRHKDVDTTTIYARLTEDPANAAMDKLGKKVVSITDIRNTSVANEKAV